MQDTSGWLDELAIALQRCAIAGLPITNQIRMDLIRGAIRNNLSGKNAEQIRATLTEMEKVASELFEEELTFLRSEMSRLEQEARRLEDQARQ